MFSHIMLGSNDIARSKKFYDATFAELGYKPGVIDERGRCFYVTDGGVFILTQPINGEPATIGNGSTFGFRVASPEQGDKWHAAGVANGGTSCENPPGIRSRDGVDLYLAYLRDPDGNKICAAKRITSK